METTLEQQEQTIDSINSPPSHGVSSGLQIPTKNPSKPNSKQPLTKKKKTRLYRVFYPKITAFQSMILLSCGAPLTPAGGSCCSLLKSLISRFLAGVDIPPLPFPSPPQRSDIFFNLLPQGGNETDHREKGGEREREKEASRQEPKLERRIRIPLLNGHLASGTKKAPKIMQWLIEIYCYWIVDSHYSMCIVSSELFIR